MGYCERDDLRGGRPEHAWLHWVDLDGDGLEDSGVVDRVIREATATVDSYLATRYPVPFSPVPDIIRDTTRKIAFWNLATGRGFDGEGADKNILLDYQAALAWLKSVSKGEAVVPGATSLGATAPTSPETAAELVCPTPTFVGRLGGYG
mgnify:CR=1 FL=1